VQAVCPPGLRLALDGSNQDGADALAPFGRLDEQPLEFSIVSLMGDDGRKADDVLLNPDIDILVELIGGYEPARTFVLRALHAGKHVVTANKAILAKYWSDIFEHARIYRRLIYFEGAVGGGIPVIQALNEGLAGNRIIKIAGILNGTTNFVLTRMSQLGITYAAALKEAQKAGFAEADPTFDVEGIDSAHKIAILASIASGTRVRLEDVVTEGIPGIDSRDMEFVRREFGYVIKLLGIARFHDEAVHLTGNLKMDTDISHTSTGFKSLLLKPLAPFFKKKNAGAVIPIAVTGLPGKYKVSQNLAHDK